MKPLRNKVDDAANCILVGPPQMAIDPGALLKFGNHPLSWVAQPWLPFTGCVGGVLRDLLSAMAIGLAFRIVAVHQQWNVPTFDVSERR